MWKKLKNLIKPEKPQNELSPQIANLRHVAIIMDGNGRWASAKGLLRSAGHRAGVKTLKAILRTANNLGIEVLTVYAFSTENWKRPQEEVDFLMGLFSEYLTKEIEEMHSENVKICFIGRIDELSEGLQRQIHEAELLTESNTGIRFNIAANYGGQDEMFRAALKIHDLIAKGKIKVEDIDAELFEKQLDTSGAPPVDLLIRTGGEYRISNFLLWQSAYAEFWFTEKNWPEFTPEDFNQALADFSRRKRRFGSLQAQAPGA